MLYTDQKRWNEEAKIDYLYKERDSRLPLATVNLAGEFGENNDKCAGNPPQSQEIACFPPLGAEQYLCHKIAEQINTEAHGEDQNGRNSLQRIICFFEFRIIILTAGEC